MPETNLKLNHLSLNPIQITKNYLFLLRNTQLIKYLIFGTIAASGLTTYFQLSPSIFMNSIGLSAKGYGWLSLGNSLSYLGGGILTRYFNSQKKTLHEILAIGSFFLALGGLSILLAHWIFSIRLFTVFIPSLFYILGVRIILPNCTAISLSSLKNQAGSTSALIGSIQMLGNTVMSFLLTFLPVQNDLTLGCIFYSKCFYFNVTLAVFGERGRARKFLRV